MTTITKLKAALDAFEAVLRWIDDYAETTGFETVEAMADAALPGLRSVIAEMEAGEPVAWRKKDTGQLEGAKAFAQPYNWGDKTKWEPLFTHPQPKAEPVQEPVGDVVDGVLMRSSIPFGYTGPLYAAAPQAKPLTDEQIDAVTDVQWAANNNKPVYAAHRAFARAIEAAHGIKP
jgi:hypothetical protein